MHIPETPLSTEDLDLMRRLAAYADGHATWHPDGSEVGPSTKKACGYLHGSIIQVVDQALSPWLDKADSREMETFTMHDRGHGRKVAHLMWQILKPARRELLTPPEIAMLVLSAYFHDIGMALTAEQRTARLGPNSDLWEKVESQQSMKARLEQLRQQIGDADLSEAARRLAKEQLDQGEEALLCEDTRSFHATLERYEQVLSSLTQFHDLEPEKIPSMDAALCFDRDSFRRRLVDICMSHNEDSDALIRRDAEHPERPRFPNEFPVGSCTGDLHLVAAALRLADILDFDRERTPAVLFHYLFPGSLTPHDSGSVLEWRKHMAISNWSIERDSTTFRGRCSDHIVHHAIVQFASLIEREIAATRATFGKDESDWPFHLPLRVATEIHEEGYRYVPYHFELDDQRIYELLMGGAIYDDPLVAVRELIQNAVDACSLRDALTRLNEPYISLAVVDRILVRYEEGDSEHPQPRLVVCDTGTGMDALLIEKYFLKVGQSYYRSLEFDHDRISLRRRGLDFAPVSDFGIGFLSCFLLTDRVKVETAMWEPRHGDSRKRTLLIDGPTRLIRLDEQQNEGGRRFKGTRITLYLVRGGRSSPKALPPAWEEVLEYVRGVCEDLPYRLNLEYVSDGSVVRQHIDPRPIAVDVPRELEASALRIRVEDRELEGEIVLVHPGDADLRESKLSTSVLIAEEEGRAGNRQYSRRGEKSNSSLLRGGFRISGVPGLPDSFLSRHVSNARLRLCWKERREHRFVSTNLARTAASADQLLTEQVTRVWLTYLLDHVDELRDGQLLYLYGPYGVDLSGQAWLEGYSAYTLYKLARTGWHYRRRSKDPHNDPIRAWEDGKEESIAYDFNGDDLCTRLLDLLLPRLSNLRMGANGHCSVTVPVPDWQKILTECFDYITTPIPWGPFADYVGGISDLLLYEYARVLLFNSRFRDRLTHFNQGELMPLQRALGKLASARGWERQPELTAPEVALVRKALLTCGDLSVGGIHGSWRLDSFNM